MPRRGRSTPAGAHPPSQEERRGGRAGALCGMTRAGACQRPIGASSTTRTLAATRSRCWSRERRGG